MDVLSDAYQWIRALHIISVIAWMAGMLYLPRLFVYHSRATAGSDQSETFKVMERKLMRGIINPAMILTTIFGVLLIEASPVFVLETAWFWVKLLALICMFAMHGMLSRWRRAFERDENPHSERFYRVINEVPAVLMVVIVIMVVARPF